MNETTDGAEKPRIFLETELPDLIDAGVEFSLQFRVEGTEEPGILRALDSQGAPAGEAPLVIAGDEDSPEEAGENEGITEPFLVSAPRQSGEYTWKALFLTGPAGEEQETASLEFSFTVRTHFIRLSFWNVPIPASRGENFTLGVGGRCSAGCSLAGLAFRFEDEEGRTVGRGRLGEEILPQTAATYWTNQELRAPEEEGLHHWTLACELPETELPHETEAETMVFRTAPPPKHTLTIKITDDKDRLPLEDAYILVGLHRGITGQDGTVCLKVPPGEQEICVTKMDYLAYQGVLTITEDQSLTIELVFAPQF
jgi:hypothetical protein